MYALDYDHYYPDQGLYQLCTKYGQYQVKPMDLFSPVAKHTKEDIEAQKKAPLATDYVYNPLRIKKMVWGSRWILIHDKEGTHENERYVLFTDGSIEKMTEEDFQKLLKKQKVQLGTTE